MPIAEGFCNKKACCCCVSVQQRSILLGWRRNVSKGVVVYRACLQGCLKSLPSQFPVDTAMSSGCHLLIAMLLIVQITVFFPFSFMLTRMEDGRLLQSLARVWRLHPANRSRTRRGEKWQGQQWLRCCCLRAPGSHRVTKSFQSWGAGVKTV